MRVKFGWIFSKILCEFVGKKKKYEIMNNYYRRRGAHIGNGCVVLSNLDLCEEELLFIGNDVVISTEVVFVTHDASLCKYLHRSGALFGKIVIGDNCFIGERATILYGVTLPANTIVASGAVVTKSVTESGLILGGNPAKIIGKISDFVNKHSGNRMSMKELSDAIIRNDERLIIR